MVPLSVIIPTLNAAKDLPAALEALRSRRISEVVIADGGSVDDTAAVALSHGAKMVIGPRGRGSQLAAGAEEATGGWFLFLHADTTLGPGWENAIVQFIGAGNDERAGYFRFALNESSNTARRLERMVAWRCRVLALPYGDQGLLISRAFYRRLGGYRPLPLMEDVDLVRRIGRARLSMLPADAITSADRWQSEGWLARSARNLGCLALYYLGIPPRFIARLYG